MKTFVWVVLALGACGDDGPTHAVVDAGADAVVDAAADLPVERSGTRLKLQWYEAGGTRERFGITDSARGEACGAAAWSDGSTRCTPLNDARRVAYSDAGCTVPLGSSYQNRRCPTPEPKYFIEYAEATCIDQPVRHLYLRGAEVAAAPRYQLVGGTCSPEIENPDYKYYAMGAEVPATELAAMTALEADAGRLHPTFWTSADGLVARSGVRDSELDVRCDSYGDVTRTASTCVPRAGGSVNAYAESTCTTPAIATEGQCTVSAIAGKYDGLNCPYASPRYFRTGAELPITDAYMGSPTTCSPADYPPTFHLYSVGAEVTAAATSPVRSGSSRIQNITWTAEGRPIQDAGLYDQDKSTACSRRTASDGIERCLPFSPSTLSYFRDAACTQPVTAARVFEGNAACGPQPAPAYALDVQLDGAEGCTDRETVYLAGAEITTPLYQMDSTCTPADRSLRAYYEVGALVPATDFVPMSLVVDP